MKQDLKLCSRKIIFILMFLVSYMSTLMAQQHWDKISFDNSHVQISIRGGASFQRIDRLEPTIGYSNNGAPPSSYEVFEKYSQRSNVGFLIAYEIEDSKAFIELGFDYSFPEGLFNDSSKHPNFRYELINDSLDIVNTYRFAHQSISLTPSVGMFFTEWFYGKFGFDWMITTTPEEIYFNTTYTSLSYQRNTQRVLRQILDIRNQFGAFAGLGFRFPGDLNSDSKMMFRIEGTVTRGLTDFIKVNPINTSGIEYYSTEVPNPTLNFFITLGFQFQIDTQ